MLIAQTTQGEYPAHIQTALIWIGAIAAVLVAVRLILWPAVKELIKEVVGFKKELMSQQQATQTTAKAIVDMASKMNDSNAIESPDPTKIELVKSVAITGTGDGGPIKPSENQWQS